MLWPCQGRTFASHHDLANATLLGQYKEIRITKQAIVTVSKLNTNMHTATTDST